MYEAMPAEQFKTLIMAMLKYKYGDETIADSIQDPMVRAIFAKEKVEIDRNEEKYEETRKKRIEAGKKGGRPRNEEQEEETHMPSKEDYINWFNKVKAEDKEEYFIMTYSTYYPSIDEAKGAVRKYFNHKFNRYWLL